MIRVQGWDLSLNHAAMVELDDAGRVTWFQFVTSMATQANPKLHGIRLVIPKSDDRHKQQLDRLVWWQAHFNAVMERNPTHVAIEDYAYSAQSNSSYQIGELGGAARLAVLSSGARLRLHDPMSVKMYVAHMGNATPDEMGEKVMERWPATKVWAKLAKEPMLDLVVAYGLAQMCRDEVMIRAGKLRVDTLPAKQIQVWNRCTKAHPISLLGREFIT